TRNLPMKKWLLWMVALIAWSGGMLLAQDIAGIWQGTLQAGRDLRTVIKISNADGGLKAVMYGIDQGGQPIAASIVRQGSMVKILVPGIGGAYEGKLSDDGTSMVGTWTQGGRPLALNLKRATTETAWAIPSPPAPLKPMAADASPVFEVATVKPSKPDAQ